MKKKIVIGQVVTEMVTGLKGTVTGRVEYLTGCAQVLVQPKAKADGDFVAAHWFDETRVEVTDQQAANVEALASSSNRANGPDSSPPVK